MFGNEGHSQDGGASEVHDFSSKAQLLGQEELDDVQKALRKEVTIFERRENLLSSFKVNYRVVLVRAGNINNYWCTLSNYDKYK